MLLDRIDIDEHGPLNRVELGPLGEQLNVVFAPIGSGKTAIARFVRDTLVDRQYPTGMLSSSTGRVVWATRSGLVNCHREQDGTRQGRKRVHFEPRGTTDPHYAAAESSWLHAVASSHASDRSFDAIKLPESIVDGVITDTSVTNVAKVVAACLRHGLDRSDTYRDLPLAESVAPVNTPPVTNHNERESLRTELARVEAELARIGRFDWDHSTLVARRNALSAQLAGWYSPDHPAVRGDTSYPYTDPHFYQRGEPYHMHGAYSVPANYEQLLHRSRDLHARVRNLRVRQSELRSWINELDRKIEARRTVVETTTDLQETLVRSRQKLQDVTAELDVCLAEAASVRRAMRWSDGRSVWMDRDAVVRELRDLDDKLATWSRRDWLLSRQHRLQQQLGHSTLTRPRYAASPLAARASEWLVRVSGGRLSQVDWVSHAIQGKGDSRRRVTVRINQKPESDFTASDRALVALSVRLAAGQLLAAMGRHVPLVIEMQREMWQHQQHLPHQAPYDTSYYQVDHSSRYNHPLIAALHDYAAEGRQVLVLTSDHPVLVEMTRSGARSFDIRPERIVHEHQPIWRPHYESESYVGPHPHTVGPQDVIKFVPAARRGVEDINRDFDVASHRDETPTYRYAEYAPAPSATYSVGPSWTPDASSSHPGVTYYSHNHEEIPTKTATRGSAPVTDWADSDVRYRDGYYYADTYTTVETSASETQKCQPCCSSNRRDSKSAITQTPSPFLLSVDSPVDQAPSIDAVAAARLRGLKVTHVTHLMQQDANRLADALGMATVDAATVRRWQAESRLCCRVPQLRNFDARILVGCGITTPAQLASFHPTDLLKEVEAFLATDRGQRILRSGTSQELARITTWIATANSGLAESGTLQGEVVRRSDARSNVGSRSDRSRLAESNGQANGFEFRTQATDRNGQTVRRRRRKSVETSKSTIGNRGQGSRGSKGRGTTSSDRSRTRRGTRSPQREVVQYEEHSQPTTWRFYLERESPVEDAPSIGARMAERLENIGIVTVDDLLQSDPESVAENLEHRRVTADTVVEWQQQATLVCCVPMLRGHDAQLLVAAEVTTPEQLAVCDATDLAAIIEPISQSNQGKRILRGGKLPDLAEVTDWIRFAQHTRELKAA